MLMLAAFLAVIATALCDTKQSCEQMKSCAKGKVMSCIQKNGPPNMPPGAMNGPPKNMDQVKQCVDQKAGNIPGVDLSVKADDKCHPGKLHEACEAAGVTFEGPGGKGKGGKGHMDGETPSKEIMACMMEIHSDKSGGDDCMMNGIMECARSNVAGIIPGCSLPNSPPPCNQQLKKVMMDCYEQYNP